MDGVKMMIVSRYIGQEIVIGECVRVVVVSDKNGRVQVGVDAPKSIEIRRGECKPREQVQIVNVVNERQVRKPR